jgi:hypothetical protein
MHSEFTSLIDLHVLMLIIYNAKKLLLERLDQVSASKCEILV